MAEWVELGSEVMVDARKGRGLSRESVSRDLHVSTKTVERYENEGRVPRQLLPTYAKIVGLEIEEPERVRVTLDGDPTPEPGLPNDLREELAEAVSLLAEVAPRFVAAADRQEATLDAMEALLSALESRLAEPRSARASSKPRQSG